MKEDVAGEKLLRRIEAASASALVGMSLLAWLGWSGRVAWGVLLGGLIALVSFWVLKWQLKKALTRSGRVPSKGGLLVSIQIRYFFTLFLVFLVIYAGWADPVPLVVGLSVVALSVVLVGGTEFFGLLVRKGEQ